MSDIVIYTKTFCSYCAWAKQLLASKGVDWTEINVSGDRAQFERMIERSGGRTTAPQIFIGDVHVGGFDDLDALDSRGGLEPLLARVLGDRNDAGSPGREPGGDPDHQMEEPLDQDHRNVIILGSGCAGLTAAIYAARANLDPLVITGREYGGQLYTTTDVENYPGFPEGIQGPELIDRMKAQAERFGAEFVHGDATALRLDDRPLRVSVDGDDEYACDALIIATGASPRELGVPGERELRGYGVSTCATCDAAFFRDKAVAVVGGGDSAMEEALFLTKFADRVTIIHRRGELRASYIMQERALNNDKIDFLWHHEVKEFLGSSETGLTGVRVVDNRTDEEQDLDVDGCFIAIGHVPNTDLVEGSPISLDDVGYIVGNGHHLPRTAIEGVFVAGDVHDHEYRQAVTAAGFGCRASIAAERWLGTRQARDEAEEPEAAEAG